MPVKLTHESTAGELVLWAIEHDGIIEERWKAQNRWNSNQADMHKALNERLTSIENKMNKLFIATGICALFGSAAIDLIKLFV